LHRPELEPDGLPLRRVQQYVSQTLHNLVQQGKARREGEDFWVDGGAVPVAYIEGRGAEGQGCKGETD
jgi:hypothetical protein